MAPVAGSVVSYSSLLIVLLGEECRGGTYEGPSVAKKSAHECKNAYGTSFRDIL